MRPVLLIAMALAALLPGDPAAGHTSGGFCDPASDSFYRRQTTVAWQPVPAQRIAEADYHGRTSEARIREQGRDVYAYRVLMNIRGKPINVSVALLDRPQEVIDVEQLASEARMLLQNEAMKLAREQRDKRAFVALSSSEYDILLWPWRSNWYFSVEAPDHFSVFQIAGSSVEFLCTYPQ